MDTQESFDLIIVGSGGGSVAASLAAKAAGLSALIIEKQGVFGGSTAYSGGVVWVPMNPYLIEPDTVEKSLQYFDAVVGNVGPASSEARRRAFIDAGPKTIAHLRSYGMKFQHAHWPDYYSARPGGMDEGRSLVAPIYNLNRLGRWTSKLARLGSLPRVPISIPEFYKLSRAKNTWAGRVIAVRVGLRLMISKITGMQLASSGNSLQGRLLEVALRNDLPIWLDTPAEDLVAVDGRVTGVRVTRDGKQITIGARRGVLLDCGGFARNRAMRKDYQSELLTEDWSMANPGDTGEMINAARKLGAAVDLMDESWWLPGSRRPDGTMSFHVPPDSAKPHCIIVDKSGARIGNEAGSYVEFGKNMLARGAVPSFAIIESRHRQSYTWGTMLPGITPDGLISSGYIKKADTLEELARKCGIDPVGLAETVKRFNEGAARGVDPDFGRGDSYYNRWNGDPSHKPNASLGAIERAPFYAVNLVPGDVGTAGGLLTDEHARVLREDGSVIEGLYAAGNCTASVMGRSYPGAGASIAGAFVFGYIAAVHACTDQEGARPRSDLRVVASAA